MHMRVRIQRIIITEILTHRLAFFSLSLSRERLILPVGCSSLCVWREWGVDSSFRRDTFAPFLFVASAFNVMGERKGGKRDLYLSFHSF